MDSLNGNCSKGGWIYITYNRVMLLFIMNVYVQWSCIQHQFVQTKIRNLFNYQTLKQSYKQEESSKDTACIHTLCNDETKTKEV